MMVNTDGAPLQLKVPTRLRRHIKIDSDDVWAAPIKDALSTRPFGVLRRNDADAVRRIVSHISRRYCGALEVYLTGEALTAPLEERRFRQYEDVTLLVVGGEERASTLYRELAKISRDKESLKLQHPGGLLKRSFSVLEAPVSGGAYETAMGYFKLRGSLTPTMLSSSLIHNYVMERQAFEALRRNNL